MLNDSFIKRIWTKPPVLFPLVALFHFVILGYTVWLKHSFPFPSEYWISSLWLLLYTISWLFACDLKRWAALTYIGLTVVNIILQLTLKSPYDLALYTPSFFLIYVLFSFFILFYYKAFK